MFIRANRTQVVNPGHIMKVGESAEGNLLLYFDEKVAVETSRRNSAEFRRSRTIL